jgi:hypothetical protein
MRIFALTLLLSSATCGGMSAGDQPDQAAELEFEVLGGLQTAAADSVAVAGTRRGEATLTGVITTPTPCYELTARLAEDGHTLVLHITASPLPRICPQVVASFEYRARLHHLGGGTYAVKVTYSYPGSGWDGKSHDLRVELPD